MNLDLQACHLAEKYDGTRGQEEYSGISWAETFIGEQSLVHSVYAWKGSSLTLFGYNMLYFFDYFSQDCGYNRIVEDNGMINELYLGRIVGATTDYETY